MATITNELVYEIQEIRDDVAHVRQRIDSHDEQFKGVRHLLIAIQSDDLRAEASIAGMRVDIDTIKRRLNLADPTH